MILAWFLVFPHSDSHITCDSEYLLNSEFIDYFFNFFLFRIFCKCLNNWGPVQVYLLNDCAEILPEYFENIFVKILFVDNFFCFGLISIIPVNT
jgi:hypothetical protein